MLSLYVHNSHPKSCLSGHLSPHSILFFNSLLFLFFFPALFSRSLSHFFLLILVSLLLLSPYFFRFSLPFSLPLSFAYMSVWSPALFFFFHLTQLQSQKIPTQPQKRFVIQKANTSLPLFLTHPFSRGRAGAHTHTHTHTHTANKITQS